MPAPQQGGGQSDNSSGIIWGVVLLFAVIGIVWYAFKDYIVISYLTIKFYEVSFIARLSSFIGDPFKYGDYFSQLKSLLASGIANPKLVTYQDLLGVGQSVGNLFKIPFAILLAILAVLVYIGNTTRVYRRIYNMKDLAKLETTNWPQISPVVNLNLVKTDIDTGPWAMAMTPIQFCKKHKLLEEYRPQRREGMSKKEWDRIEVNLKRGQANRIFALQLGPMWKGVDKLPPYIKALFAVFAARINADTKEAAKLIEQLNISSMEKLNFTGVDQLIKKHINSKEVQHIINSHAYVFTVMASMLEIARQDGVQASADFLWLKPLDRKLWYILNNVGRQTAFSEVAGIYAHWISEKNAGRKLLVPMIDEATNALEGALKEIVYRPDENRG